MFTCILSRVVALEKSRLISFVAKVMEESGFKVYKNFETSRHIIDIYGVLPTILGDMGVVVACKNYDEKWDVGIDIVKEMEMIGKLLKASKIVVVTTSYFTDNAANYAGKRNIKLIDKDGILSMAKKFSKKTPAVEETADTYEDDDFEDYTPSSGSSLVSPRRVRSGPNLVTSLRSGKKLRKVQGEAVLPRIMPKIKLLLKNTVVLIILVLLLSSLAAYLVGLGNKSTAILGVSKILVSAILSYGIVLGVEKDATVMLVKGTTVFFASMVIYAILVVLL